METKIKVIVEYEKPEMSKFEALVAEYKAAKAVADVTEETLMPLIKVGGKAKYLALCDQLTVIGEQFKECCIATGIKYRDYIWAQYKNEYGSDNYFIIQYNPDDNTLDYEFNIYQLASKRGQNFMNFELSPKSFIGEDGIVTRWNQLNIIEQLQQHLESAIRNAINVQNNRTKEIQNHLKNIRG